MSTGGGTAGAPLVGGESREPRSSFMWIDRIVRWFMDTTPDVTPTTVSPEVLSVDISYTSTGDSIVFVNGSQTAANIYINVGINSVPGDPTDVSNDGSLAARNGQITTTINSKPADLVYVKGIAYDSDGVPGDVSIFRVLRGDSENLPFTVQVEQTQTGSVGSLAIIVTDNSLATSAIEFQKKTGAGDYGGSWLTSWDDAGTGTPGTNATYNRGEDINLLAKHNGAIKVRITYTDEQGVSPKYWEMPFPFDEDHIAEITTIGISFAPADGDCVANVIGDEDTVKSYVTVGDGSVPSDPTASVNDGTIPARTGAVDTGKTTTVGNEIVVKAVGENSLGDLGPVQVEKKIRGVGKVTDKPIRIAAAAFRKINNAQSFNYGGNGYVSPGTAATQLAMLASLILPKGVTITSFAARTLRSAAGDLVTVQLESITDADARTIESTITSTSTTGAFITTTNGGLSKLISASNQMWQVRLFLRGTAAPADARLLWIELLYDSPDVDKTL